MDPSSFLGVISTCSPNFHAQLDFRRIPCGLMLSVNVRSHRSPLAHPAGARFTSIIIGSLRSSLPLKWPSRPIPCAPCAATLDLDCTTGLVDVEWSLSGRLYSLCG